MSATTKEPTMAEAIDALHALPTQVPPCQHPCKCEQPAEWVVTVQCPGRHVWLFCDQHDAALRIDEARRTQRDELICCAACYQMVAAPYVTHRPL